MSHYRPRKITPLRVFAMFVRGMGHLVAGLARLWMPLAIAAFLISPIGPHLRIQYRYMEVGHMKYYSQCDYLGSRGWVRNQKFENCPIVVFIDSRKYARF